MGGVFCPSLLVFMYGVFLVQFVFSTQFKMWLKPNAEQSFLYGNHVSKSGLGRITENIPQYQGVVLYSMSDAPLVCVYTCV